MSYQVLARKWRPRSFKSMVGQEPILRMLVNALEQQRLHHAYLFTGTRGVGKTTLARILAKCLNCETGVTATPCDTCPTCIAIDAGQFLDLYEVDAASRTKVEDTRELLDNVLYPPTQGRYKVYLIDEVHMLSNHSFNALLKTLEEPPKHVKFFLATTEPNRLPITILSRCLQFHLKRISVEQIATHLQHICQTENITHDQPALENIAQAADGSMRDALSLLDQAIAYGQGQVNSADVSAMLGTMARDDLLPLLQALAKQDGNALFSCIRQLAERALDFHHALETLISLFHQIAIAQIIADLPATDATVVTLAKQFTPEEIQLYYQIALLGRRDLPLAPTPQQGFEMTMLRLLAFQPASSGKITPVIATPATTPATDVGLREKHLAQPTATLDWRELLPKLGLSGMAYALAANCTLQSYAENKMDLALSANHLPMLNQKLKERIGEAVSRHLQRTIQLEIHLTTEEIATPLKQDQQERQQQLSSHKQAVLQDPKVQQLIDMCDATVDVALIT